jgi:hypothetical protein
MLFYTTFSILCCLAAGEFYMNEGRYAEMSESTRETRRVEMRGTFSTIILVQILQHQQAWYKQSIVRD